MIKKPVAFETLITINDIRSFLEKMDYHLENDDQYFFKIYQWKEVIKDSDQAIERYGLGIFKNTTDITPLIIMDFDNQLIIILDEKIINFFKEKFSKDNLEYLTLPFDQAFDQKFSYKEIDDMTIKNEG